MKKGDTIKIQIKVKASKDELPDWGLGKGILAEQEVILGEDVTEQNKFRYQLKMDEIYNDLLDNTLEKVIQIVEPK